jgi:Tol biopolymer transport system component
MIRVYLRLSFILLLLFAALITSMMLVGRALRSPVVMFLTYDSLAHRLNIMDVDRRLNVDLMSVPGAYSHILSPDGQWVAYISGYSLGVLNIQSNHEFIVAELTTTPAFVWSPNSRELAYSDNGLNIVEMDSWNVRTISTGLIPEVTWLPDNTSLVFTTGSRGEPDILTIEANGENQHTLVQNVGLRVRHPSWSSDGRFLAFTAYSPPIGGSLNLLEVETGIVRVLVADDVFEIISMAWSHDSTRLGFTGTIGYIRGVYVIDPIVGDIALVWSGLAQNLAWSPDSEQLLIDSLNVNTSISELHLVNPDGSGSICLTCSSTINPTSSFIWLP